MDMGNLSTGRSSRIFLKFSQLIMKIEKLLPINYFMLSGSNKRCSYQFDILIHNLQ
jgi:hypothetical protein